MILIKNTQRTVAIDTEQLQTLVANILRIIGHDDFGISVWLTTEKTIRTYNKQYRNKDAATDVLSFPFHDVKPGQKITATSSDERYLGDIILAPAYIKKDLENWPGQNFNKRMKILLVHSICHLLGYDHITDDDFAIMHKKEMEILKKLDDS